MVAFMCFLASESDSEALRRLRESMSSWPVQTLIVLLYLGLAVLLVRHAAREWENGLRNRYFRAGIVAGGAFVALQFLLGSTLLGVVRWPTWLYMIEFIGLFGLCLYFFVRFVTRQHGGGGDAETRRRGAALENLIALPHEKSRRAPGA